MAIVATSPANQGAERVNSFINFDKEKVIRGRWKIIGRLGVGGCGSVYKVVDLTRKGYMAALKAEARTENDHGILKLEVSTLNRMKNCQHVIRLLEAGHRKYYNYMVITLCGSDLMTLKRKSKDGFCESTLVRIGIYALYAIKQVHEMGFVHRDVKPGNIMNGVVGRDRRMFFLIDFGKTSQKKYGFLGMARSFVVRKDEKLVIRKPRNEVLLRGTLRYCSLSVHERKEQGRVDDLWAMLYMLVELYIGLPWHKKNETDIILLKRTISDAELFNECPPEFILLADYLRTLTYESRPDYFKIYEMLMTTMKRENYSFTNKYDWEEDEKMSDMQTALEYSDRERKSKNPLNAQEVEYLIYPCANPKYFKEKILDL